MISPRVVVTICTLLVAIGGCDPQVDRFQENDQHYSVFGYLNASAERQIVRVEPLRDGELIGVPRTLDAEVTLTNLATDQTVALQDSLWPLGGGEVAHNFYANAEVTPSTPYRLTVQGSDGAETWVETTVPDTFPSPTVVHGVEGLRFVDCEVASSGRLALLNLRGIDRLVAVKSLMTTTEAGVWDYNHLADTLHVEDGLVRAQVDYAEAYCAIPERFRTVTKIEIMIAAGSPDWPNFIPLDRETQALPAVGSNVTGGVGFVGGVVTDTVTVYP